MHDELTPDEVEKLENLNGLKSVALSDLLDEFNLYYEEENMYSVPKQRSSEAAKQKR